MLCPMADLINHYSHEHCTTDMAHVGLELEHDKKKREQLNYRKMRGNYNMSLLIPKTHFDGGDRKSNAIHFVETFAGRMYNYQELTEEQEVTEAIKVASTLLEDHEEADIWDLPVWTSEYKEDNESSGNESDEEPESEEGFFDQVHKLQEKLITKPKKFTGVTSTKGLSKEDLYEIARESALKRPDVLNCQLGLTQKASTHSNKSNKRKENIQIAKPDSLDESESYSEHQEDYPWYSSKDKEVGLLYSRYTSSWPTIGTK